MLGGRVALVFFVFGLAVFIVWMMRWWAQGYRRTEATLTSSSPVGQAAVVLAAMIYVVFAIALTSVTVKVQDELRELGYVYTFYAMGSCVVALGIAIAIRSIYFRQGGATLRYLLCAFAIGFLVVQSTINWRLSEQLNQAYLVNHRLLDAFDEDVEESKRCDAFATWAQVPWPTYYRDGMRDGLQEAYQYYFDEPFCASLANVQL
jgi:hypothetical protein